MKQPGVSKLPATAAPEDNAKGHESDRRGQKDDYSSDNNASDGGGRRGPGGEVVGDETGENRRRVEVMRDRAGPASLLVLLKELYPRLLSWLCVSLFVWWLTQPQGGGCSAIE